MVFEREVSQMFGVKVGRSAAIAAVMTGVTFAGAALPSAAAAAQPEVEWGLEWTGHSGVTPQATGLVEWGWEGVMAPQETGLVGWGLEEAGRPTMAMQEGPQIEAGWEGVRLMSEPYGEGDEVSQALPKFASLHAGMPAGMIPGTLSEGAEWRTLPAHAEGGHVTLGGEDVQVGHVDTLPSVIQPKEKSSVISSARQRRRI